MSKRRTAAAIVDALKTNDDTNNFALNMRRSQIITSVECCLRDWEQSGHSLASVHASPGATADMAVAKVGAPGSLIGRITTALQSARVIK